MSGRRRKTNRKVDVDDDSSSNNEILSDVDQDYAAPTKPSRKRKTAKETTKNKKRSTEDIYDSYDSENEEVVPEELKSNFEAGIIKKIDVTNFMCHRRFTVELGRNLNFITGKNGSGKSAIATAIQLCLGATARTTGRGTNLSTFIREGSDRPAIVKVTLSNRGPDAFQPDKYGHSITVERTLTKGSGTPGYVLYDYNGKEVSRQRSDLETMLRSFNIYVDNPCCILTQEESKKFINGKDEDKYEFFLKATGLYNLKEELKSIIENIEKSMAKRNIEMGKLEHKKQSVEELKRLYDRLQQLDSMDKQIKICKGKISWIDYHQALEVVEKVQKEVELKTQKVLKAKKLLDENSGGADGITEDQLKEIEFQINEIEASLKQLDEEIAKIIQEERNAMKNGTLLKSQCDGHKKSLREFVDRHKKLSDDIVSMQQRALEGAKAGERLVLEKRERIVGQIEDLQKEEQTIRLEKVGLSTQLQEMKGSYARSQGNASSLRAQIGTLQGEIRNLSESGQNKATSLAPYMGALLQEISKRTFRGPVYGPVGVCVKLNEGYDKWSKALERALGAQLRSFIVTCPEDRKAINDLARNLRYGSSVTIVMQSNVPRYNVPVIEQEGVVSVLQAITVTDDLVFNCLVDQLGIERTILVEKEDDVTRYHVQQSRVGLDELKYNASAAITLEGTLIRYTNGNQASEVNRFQHINILAKDKQALIQTARQNLESKIQELKAVEEEQKALQLAVKPFETQYQQQEQRLLFINNEIKRLSRSKQQVEMEINDIKEANSIDITPYEAEKEELRLAIEKMKEEIVEMVRGMDENGKECQQIRRAKAGIETQKKGHFENIKNLEEESTRIVTERQRMQKAKEAIQRQANTLQADLQKEEESLAKLQEVANQKEQEAIAFCQETIDDWSPEVTELSSRQDTRENLTRKMKELKAEIVEGRKNATEKGYTLPVVENRYLRAKGELDELESIFENLTHNIDLLVTSQEERKKKWMTLYKTTTEITRKQFDHYVQAKGSSGTIKFDGKNEKVQLTYQVDNSDKNSIANDVRNLSGGERSFVTYCLQLALGHVIECPFRLLDEYDIFMDEVTRKLTLDNLQDYARLPEQRNRQFIILTPHRLPDITPSKFIKVLNMNPPERHSAAGLQQQTLD